MTILTITYLLDVFKAPYTFVILFISQEPCEGTWHHLYLSKKKLSFIHLMFDNK